MLSCGCGYREPADVATTGSRCLSFSSCSFKLQNPFQIVQIILNINFYTTKSSKSITYQVLECAMQPFVDIQVPATISTFAGKSLVLT